MTKWLALYNLLLTILVPHGPLLVTGPSVPTLLLIVFFNYVLSILHKLFCLISDNNHFFLKEFGIQKLRFAENLTVY
jgi:hypothetical protein